MRTRTTRKMDSIGDDIINKVKAAKGKGHVSLKNDFPLKFSAPGSKLNITIPAREQNQFGKLTTIFYPIQGYNEDYVWIYFGDKVVQLYKTLFDQFKSIENVSN